VQDGFYLLAAPDFVFINGFEFEWV